MQSRDCSEHFEFWISTDLISVGIVCIMIHLKMVKCVMLFKVFLACIFQRLNLSFHFFFFYSVVLISGVQESDSVIHTHIYMYTYVLSFRCFSIISCYKLLNVVPCAIH